MTVNEFLRSLKRIHVAARAPAVATTVAEEIRLRFAPGAMIRHGREPARPASGSLVITVAGPPGPWLSFHVGPGGRGRLAASDAEHLYAHFRHLLEVRGDDDLARYRRPRRTRPAFRAQRPVFDLYFAQSGRTIAGQDRESSAREMARVGFTHIEVNSLASPEALEPGVRGEVYPRFYTYCPALDQFVSSFLNRGIYPEDWLAGNLARLKEGASLALRYGLIPTLTCFEPRSVPDRLLERYPELRGCRVDHPFRSFRPRYNLAVSHPVVQRHYRELVGNLLREVPALGLLSVWTNDSGAGLEFTRSLYAGANGSAYLVREWSDEDVFARSAAANATRFLRLLQEAGAAINPKFRVATRLEPFGPERVHVLRAVGNGLDVEVPTLLASGWDSPYGHPVYRDSTIGPFTIYNNAFLPEERPAIGRLARRGCRTHVMHAHGPVNNFEPLLGVPSPWLTREKLIALWRNGARDLAHFGGIAPPAAVPYPVNEEVFRRFQHAPGEDTEQAVREIATSFAGAREGHFLLEAWRLAEQGIRGFMPNPLYFLWGVWYRIEIRPLVPDIEAIPEADRAYYERHLLATHHNPARVDLARDVLFRLMSPSLAAKAVSRNDRMALPPLARAIAILSRRIDVLDGSDPAHAVLSDQRDRLAALRHWMTTRRNVAAWIAHVHGWLAARDHRRRSTHMRRLAEMVESEILNTQGLHDLWKASRTRFLAVSAGRETTFIYDRHFGEHLERKLDLMRRYGDRAPRIDPGIMWRVAALPGGAGGAPGTLASDT